MRLGVHVRSRVFTTLVACIAAAGSIAVVAVVANAHTGVQAHAAKSKKGKTGPRGPRGPRGFTGARGSQGIQGIQGKTGNTGPAGAAATPFQIYEPIGTGAGLDFTQSSDNGTLFPIVLRCVSDHTGNYSAALLTDLPKTADPSNNASYSAQWSELSPIPSSQTNSGATADPLAIDGVLFTYTASTASQLFPLIASGPAASGASHYDVADVGSTVINGGDGQDETVNFAIRVDPSGTALGGAACYGNGTIEGSAATP
jgi:Collagen triple helix repeat (20 copies)